MLQVGLGVVGARDGLAIITCTCLTQIDLILITNLFFGHIVVRISLPRASEPAACHPCHA